MAIAFRAAGAVNSGTSLTTITLAAPAGTVSGDVVLAVFFFVGGSGPTITPPSGWTLANRTNSGAGASDSGSAVYWGLGSASFTGWGLSGLSSAPLVGYTLGYTGVDTTTPMDATAVGQAAATNTVVSTPSITTVTANAMLVGFFGWIDTTGFTAPPTWSAEFGAHRQVGNVDGSGSFTSSISMDTADATQVSAGASGAKSATASISAPNSGQLIALRPASGGGGSPAPTTTFDYIYEQTYRDLYWFDPSLDKTGWLDQELITKTAVAAALAGNLFAVSSVTTASLTTAIQNAASVAALSSVPNATLTTAIQNAASVAALSSVISSSLTTAIQAAASIAALSSVPSAVLTTAIQNNASVAALSSVPNATLTTSIVLAGSLAALSSVINSSLTTAIQNNASVAALSSVPSASLTTAIQLAISVAALSSVISASLSTLDPISASVAAISSSPSSSLTTAINLVGSLTAISSVTPGLTTAIQLAGSLAALSTATPGITTAIVLAANIGAISTSSLFTGFSSTVTAISVVLSASLSTSINLAGNVAALSTATPGLSTSIVLLGNLFAVSTQTSAITTAITMAAILAAISTATTDLTVPKPLAASVSAVSASTVALTTVIKLLGSLAAISAAQATFTLNVTLLVGNLFCLTSTTADLLVPKPLASNVTTTATILSSSMITQILLNAISSTVSTAFPNFTTATPMFGSAFADSEVINSSLITYLTHQPKSNNSTFVNTPDQRGRIVKSVSDKNTKIHRKTDRT